MHSLKLVIPNQNNRIKSLIHFCTLMNLFQLLNRIICKIVAGNICKVIDFCNFAISCLLLFNYPNK